MITTPLLLTLLACTGEDAPPPPVAVPTEVVTAAAPGSIEDVLTENQSVYLPLGTVHRLHNPGRIPLEIIEVQTGSYLGEDDIVRLGDQYGRG